MLFFHAILHACQTISLLMLGGPPQSLAAAAISLAEPAACVVAARPVEL